MFPRKLHRYEVHGAVHAICDTFTHTIVIIIHVTINCHDKLINEPIQGGGRKHVDLGRVNRDRPFGLCAKTETVSLWPLGI